MKTLTTLLARALKPRADATPCGVPVHFAGAFVGFDGGAFSVSFVEPDASPGHCSMRIRRVAASAHPSSRSR
jgi:hypothetical protein